MLQIKSKSSVNRSTQLNEVINLTKTQSKLPYRKKCVHKKNSRSPYDLSICAIVYVRYKLEM